MTARQSPRRDMPSHILHQRLEILSFVNIRGQRRLRMYFVRSILWMAFANALGTTRRVVIGRDDVGDCQRKIQAYASLAVLMRLLQQLIPF
jgi:hypothetical protein